MDCAKKFKIHTRHIEGRISKQQKEEEQHEGEGRGRDTVYTDIYEHEDTYSNFLASTAINIVNVPSNLHFTLANVNYSSRFARIHFYI